MPACMHVCDVIMYVVGLCPVFWYIGVDTSDPALMALQLCYSDIKTALDSHITAVVSSSFSHCLIPPDVHSTIISSPSMPSGDKVNTFLNAVERKISADNIKVFADVLKNQGSYLSVIGSDLENMYCEYIHAP